MRVLIVGFGSIAKKHVSALRQLYPDVEIVALRSSANAATEPGVVNVYNAEALGTWGFEFVVVSNPTFLHKQTIGQLLYLNLPLFIEKPLFDTLGNDELLQRIAAANLKTYVACNMRFLKSLGFAKETLAGRRINEVNIYCGSYLPDWRPGQNFKDVYSAHKEMGGGVHIDLIHELDYAYWLFKKPMHVRKTTTSASSLGITAVDHANYLWQYETYNVSIVLNYYRRDAKRTLEVVCEDGTLKADLLRNNVRWNGDLIFESDQRISDTYVDQMRFFIEKVLRNGENFNTVTEAYEILNLCLADA